MFPTGATTLYEGVGCKEYFHRFHELFSLFRSSLFVLVNQVTKNTQMYGFSHSKTINALGLRHRAFISEFFVFRNPDETLALVFEIVLKMLVSTSP